MSVTSILLLSAPVLAGVLVGYVTGGRLSALASVRLRALWLLWIAVAIQAMQYHVGTVRELLEERLGVPMLALTFAVVVVWIAVNLRASGPLMRIALVAILLGALSNATAIAANGRMPYSPRAAAAAGLPADTATPKNVAADRHTRLAFLGDVIPVPLLGKVVSAGDLSISLGGAIAIVAAMRRRNRTDRKEVEDDSYDHLETGPVRDVPARLAGDAAVHDRRPRAHSRLLSRIGVGSGRSARSPHRPTTRETPPKQPDL
jgi:hypothetical protein